MSDFGFYFTLGWEHIISTEALDHILFIAALAAIYMLRDWKRVILLVTAFTAGHTISLVLSVRDLVTAPSDWVEFLIPCTILFTATSNLFLKSFTATAIRINYLLALLFGLVHGLAFASVLKEILASDQDFVWSMFSFSTGLELGQVLVVGLVLLLAELFVSLLKVRRREWMIFISATVFGLALQMVVQRIPGRDSAYFKENAPEKSALCNRLLAKQQYT
ncbi:MAG TPA: HupE/UreJ family protein [Flavisolibacter sp.]